MKLLVLTTVSALALAGCTQQSTLVCPDTVYINKVETPIDTCREENKPRFTLAVVTPQGNDDKPKGNPPNDEPPRSEPPTTDVPDTTDTPNTHSTPNKPDRVKGNNGWGNGDQSAPGNSRENNNAENSNRSQRNHGQGNKN